jgi:hypothetical protein
MVGKSVKGARTTSVDEPDVRAIRMAADISQSSQDSSELTSGYMEIPGLTEGGCAESGCFDEIVVGR